MPIKLLENEFEKRFVEFENLWKIKFDYLLLLLSIDVDTKIM